MPRSAKAAIAVGAAFSLLSFAAPAGAQTAPPAEAQPELLYTTSELDAVDLEHVEVPEGADVTKYVFEGGDTYIVVTSEISDDAFPALPLDRPLVSRDGVTTTTAVSPMATCSRTTSVDPPYKNGTYAYGKAKLALSSGCEHRVPFDMELWSHNWLGYLSRINSASGSVGPGSETVVYGSTKCQKSGQRPWYTVNTAGYHQPATVQLACQKA